MKKYLDELGQEEISPGVFISVIYKNLAYRNEWLRVRRKALKSSLAPLLRSLTARIQHHKTLHNTYKTYKTTQSNKPNNR